MGCEGLGWKDEGLGRRLRKGRVVWWAVLVRCFAGCVAVGWGDTGR